MRVYVAGPMRGIRAFNFPAFGTASDALADRGHTVFNPADHDRQNGFDPTGMTGDEDLAALGFDLRGALAADMEFIARHADAVAVLTGWERSSGARAEVALAHALGLPVAHWRDIISHALQIGDGARGIPDSILITAATPPSGGLLHAVAREMVGADPITAEAARAALADLPPQSGEVRKVSATGGEKGSKLARFDLLPVEALTTVAQLYGRGANKYAAHNWRRGYDWSLSFAALQRHATQFWAGEDNDEEMGLPHMAAVVFHALALLTFMTEQRQFDDRYQAKGKAA
jgi:hypothetical protein